MAGPHGIQPLPNAAIRRATRGLTEPLTQIGTPPDWRGLGMAWMPSKANSSEV